MTVTKKRAEPEPMLEFDYPWIRAWGAYIDATRPMIEEQLELARSDAVPDTVLWLGDPFVFEPAEVPTWKDLADLKHGRSRVPQVTDQRMFLWDWGMARGIHLPDPVLRDWLTEIVLDPSLPDRW